MFAEFSQSAASLGLADVGRHIRFPVRERSTLRGSPAGASVWSSVSGRAIEEELARVVTAASGPPEPSLQFVLAEVYGRVASFVEEALSAESLDQFISNHLDRLIQELTAPPTGVCHCLWGGTRVTEEGFSFHDYLQVVPASGKTVDAQFLNAVDRDWVSMPNEPAVLASSRVQLPTRQSPLPAADAVFQALTIQHDLALAGWLTTGHRPIWLVRWMGEDARFPVSRPTHEARSVYEGGVQGLCPVQPLEPKRLSDAFLLVRDREWLGFDDDSFDDPTSLALRAAFYLVDAADRSIEAAQVLVQTYSALEGLLTEAPADTRVVSRASVLIGSGPRERKLLTTRLNAVRAFRNTIAHGRRPDWDVAQAAAGLNSLDPGSLLDRSTLENELRRESREILRCAFGSFLWLAAQTEVVDGRSRSVPAMTKHEVLELLDQARAKSLPERTAADTLLAERLPLWLRDPLGRAP